MTTRRSISPMRRLRIFESNGGRCHLCGNLIKVGQKWDVSHDRPLALLGEDGGDNLKVAHRLCHRYTTKADLARIAKAKRVKAKHIGIRKRSSFATNRDGKYKAKIGGGVELRSPRMTRAFTGN